MTFKEDWLKEDERCIHCGNVTKQAKGLNRQNVRKLFRIPSFNDLLMLFIIIMLLVVSWAYNRDVALCRSYIKNQQGKQLNPTVFNNPNSFTNLTIINNSYGEDINVSEKEENKLNITT
jgi:hypothetical protein